MRRKSKSETSKLQRKCDALLTPIIKEMYPKCLLNGSVGNTGCSYNTEVAHHHVHKSKCLNLRYDLENLIPLCNHCHLMLHHNESYWASKVVEIKGSDWFKYLEKKKWETIKADKYWYNEQLERLQKYER